MLENAYTTKMSSNKKKLKKRFLCIGKTRKSSKLFAVFASLFLLAAVFAINAEIAALSAEGEADELVTLYQGGERIELENAPFIEDNMVYFPLRECFEKLGVLEISQNRIDWNNGEIAITVAAKEGGEAVLYRISPSSNQIKVSHNASNRDFNAEFYEKPTMGLSISPGQYTPIIKNGKTYVPYTFLEYMLCRGLGAKNSDVFDFMFTVNQKNGIVMLSGGFYWPCDGKISSPFGVLENPISGKKTNNNGIDIAAAEGESVIASISGSVSDVGYDADRGYYISVKKDNIEVSYSSLLNLPSLKQGDKVVMRQALGKVGSRGKSTGAHLHFEVKINGEYVNPELVQ